VEYDFSFDLIDANRFASPRQKLTHFARICSDDPECEALYLKLMAVLFGKVRQWHSK
jgi:hypothetical protein